MDLLILSGFLGSGKTTLLRQLADAFEERNPGMKMAIIENEVGKVGIDGGYLQKGELMVKEINSGCICCSLRFDLKETLQEIENEYEPDLVVIEPSGVAGPKQLMKQFKHYHGNIENMRMLSVIDASRVLKISDMTIPIVADGISIADLVVVNKIDLVNDDELREVREKIGFIRSDAPVVEIAALETESSNMDAVIEKAFCREYSGSEGAVWDELEADESVVKNATVHALERDFEFCCEKSFGEVKEEMVSLVQKIALKLKDSGCSIIGHLKAVLRTEKQGLLLVSTTAFEQRPHAKGVLEGRLKKCKLIMNAIVYDVEKERLRELVETEVGKHLFETSD